MREENKRVVFALVWVVNFVALIANYGMWQDAHMRRQRMHYKIAFKGHEMNLIAPFCKFYQEKEGRGLVACVGPVTVGWDKPLQDQALSVVAFSESDGTHG